MGEAVPAAAAVAAAMTGMAALKCSLWTFDAGGWRLDGLIKGCPLTVVSPLRECCRWTAGFTGGDWDGFGEGPVGLHPMRPAEMLQ